MLKVLMILPYPELEPLVLQVIANMGKGCRMEVDVRCTRAEELRSNPDYGQIISGYDVLIGRGHTARILKKLNSAPVIDIPVTGYDVLRAISEARSRFDSRKIALFLSDVQNHDEQILSSVFGIAVNTFVVKDIADMESTMSTVRQQGYDTVVGGYSSWTRAKQCGLSAVMIQTGEEAIIQAFREAQNMVTSIEKERERAKVHQTVTQISKDGILYVNEVGVVNVINKRGLQILSSPVGAVQGSPLSQVYPFLEPFCRNAMEWKIPVLNEILEIDSRKVTFDFVPVLVKQRAVGVVITFQSVSKIQQMETQIRKRLSERGLVAKYTFNDIIHKSDIMEQTICLAHKYAAVSSNILIVGETGTGKELLAQGIHNMSERNKKPFVAINCAALPENLLESELFGYVEGAFTGSKKGGKMGLFEQAHQGTLFLDEISELPYVFQGELLRVLQEKQVRRIGDDRVIDVDVRIIAATNRNLKQLVEDGSFRRDLLYRLDILKIYVPPLCDRGEDVILIFQHLLHKYSVRFGKDTGRCTKEALQLLRVYPFEGNIRELSNITERLCVMAEGPVIDEPLMRRALYPEDIHAQSRKAAPPAGDPDPEKTECEEIQAALDKTGGKKAEAARLLGIDRSTLWRKMKHYGLDA